MPMMGLADLLKSGLMGSGLASPRVSPQAPQAPQQGAPFTPLPNLPSPQPGNPAVPFSQLPRATQEGVNGMHPLPPAADPFGGYDDDVPDWWRGLNEDNLSWWKAYRAPSS